MWFLMVGLTEDLNLSASAQVDKDSKAEFMDSYRQTIKILEHKIRNLEKRKGKLDEYKQEQEEGKELSADKLAAVSKHNEVIQQLDFSRDLIKQLGQLGEDTSRAQKRQQKKEQADRTTLETDRYRQLLVFQRVLDKLSNDKTIRQDFLHGVYGTVLSQEDVRSLEEFASLICPEKDHPDYLKLVEIAAEHISCLFQGKAKSVAGKNYKKLHALLLSISSCDYFDPQKQQRKQEQQQLVVDEPEPPPTPPPVLAQDIQKSTFNYMQESQIDIETSQMENDPTVVSVSSFVSPPLQQMNNNQNVFNSPVDSINVIHEEDEEDEDEDEEQIEEWNSTESIPNNTSPTYTSTNNTPIDANGRADGANIYIDRAVRRGLRSSNRVSREDVDNQIDLNLIHEESIATIEVSDSLSGEPMFEDESFMVEEEELFSEDGHPCAYCDEVFSSKIKLNTHTKTIHPDESSLNVSKAKKKRTTGQRRQDVLKCTQCQRIFNHRNSLVYHMRSHTGERPHQCEMCGKSFFATSALKVHMRLHSGEKPYKCESCGRNFRQWGDLKYHMISIHSDIRQYQCEFCGKDFARKYSLIVHRRIHTGERNYKCEYCGKCFRAASYLQNHRRIHTGEKPRACSTCGKPFRVRSDMKRHMASHNREHNHGHASNAQQQQQSQQQQQNVQNVVTVSSITTSGNQIITIGPQITQQIAQAVRSGSSIQHSVSSDNDLQQTQQIAIEDEVVITGDIHGEGTPINITLTQDGLSSNSLEAAAVATLQPAEIQDGGVLYPNQETVTIRESTNGTHVFVWPVYMN